MPRKQQGQAEVTDPAVARAQRVLGQARERLNNLLVAQRQGQRNITTAHIDRARATVTQLERVVQRQIRFASGERDPDVLLGKKPASRRSTERQVGVQRGRR